MKKILSLTIIVALLFLVSCEKSPVTPTGTTASTTTFETTTAPITSASHYAAVESPSRILLFHGGTLWYYSKADGESYRFCFNPLCQHSIKENCSARWFMSHYCRSDGCVYSEKYNRFYFSRGQNIYSCSFDASDFKLEYSFGENGKILSSFQTIELFTYDFFVRRMLIYDDYIYFIRTNAETGRWQLVRLNIKNHKIDEMTSADDEWVLGYEIANGYIYFKTFDSDNIIRHYTADMSLKERKLVLDPIYFDNIGVSLGLFDGEYFYEEIANGQELYKINPLTGEKSLIVKDERLTGNADLLCVRENDGIYVVAENIIYLGTIESEVFGTQYIGTSNNNVWKISFDGEFEKVLDFPRGDIETMNFVEEGVIIHFSQIYHKEINVEDPERAAFVFVLFEIDENGNFVNPKPIGNNANNEDLITFFEGDWH